MIIYQERHFQPAEDSLIYDYESNMGILNAVLGNIEYAPGVSSLNNTAIDGAVQGVMLNKNHEEMLENFQRLAEMGIFTFKMNQANTATFTAIISGREFELPAHRDGAYITATDWLSYLQCATIANYKAGLDYLLSVPSEVFEMTSASFNIFDQTLVECYKSIYLDSENEEKVMQLIEKVTQNTDHPYLENYVIPALAVYKSLYTKQHNQIEEAIVEALNKHFNYWSIEERKYGTRGWISIPLISVLIHKGYKTAVESDYLPKNIIP